jgi:hypothetical protein
MFCDCWSAILTMNESHSQLGTGCSQDTNRNGHIFIYLLPIKSVLFKFIPSLFMGDSKELVGRIALTLECVCHWK